MPQAIGIALAGLLSNGAAALGASVATQASLAAFGASLGTVVFAAGLAGAELLLAQRPVGQKPSDGQQTLNQPLPARMKAYARIGSAWIDPS